ncbi:MAG: hypothetical protein KatS3mg076_1870 [Candidatus Binatia bacterium]|nr:MAG: hypothetical protein KatS3mg076_1870 [Candidatus Binatia bacterium]
MTFRALFAFLLASSALALGTTVNVHPEPARPGDILVIEASHYPKRGTLDLQLLRFVKLPDGRGRALAGVDLEADFSHPPFLDVRWTFAPPLRRTLALRPRPAVGAVPRTTFRDLPQIDSDLWCRGRPSNPLWRENFVPPVEAEVSLPFAAPISDGKRWGALGFLAGVPDIPVRAANDGRVVFAGELGRGVVGVVLDHGGSVCTVYAPLSELRVEGGRRVRRGEVLGELSGETLYWEARVLRARVDPAQLYALGSLKGGRFR